ncbi:AI-2E family transporter [Candidatus Uhrbacteria bacterium]|nr:AI-2E family transporter [Candidatus Uhrbacteria bacterium]
MSAPRLIAISTGTILKTIAIFIGLAMLWLIRDILIYIFSAILLAGVIYPFASWAAAHRIPKGLSVIIFYIFIFGMIGATVSLLIPALVDQSRNFVSLSGASSGWVSELLNSLKQFSEQHGLTQNLPSSVVGFETQLQSAFGGLFGLVTGIFGGIVGFFVVLILSFYLVVEDSAIRKLFHNFVPERYQEFAAQVSWQMMNKLGAWFRGQVFLGLIIGILYFIGFSIIGVPYALLLAVIGGLLEFIPYVGPFMAAVPALLLAFLAFPDSPVRVVATLVLMLIIQRLENDIIVPKVMQKAVGLNPIVSIIAFMVGAQLFGVVGAIFAIPVATAISVALTEVMRFRERRPLARSFNNERGSPQAT